MTEDELKKRTKEFGKRGLKLIEELPNTIAGRIVANQFGRSVTSVGANYRAACRARSKADFNSKPGIVEKKPPKALSGLRPLSNENAGSAASKTPPERSE